jgi:hypothetical protein
LQVEGFWEEVEIGSDWNARSQGLLSFQRVYDVWSLR